MAIKPIQTMEGGPEYDSWATSTQMDRLIATLKSTGISQSNAKQLVSLLDNIKDGGKVDTKVLQQVLGNLKTASRDEKTRDKADEVQDKAQRTFWQKSHQNAQAATRAFKNANIADALRETRDLGMVPIESLSDAFTKATTIVSSFATGIFGAANSIISSLGSIGAGVGKVLGFFGGIIGGIGGLLATGIAALVGAIDGMGDVFFKLYNTGINMAFQQGQAGHGFSSLAMAAKNARLTIGEFGEFISENSRVAVAIGADAMGQLSNTVRKAMIPLGQLGLSMSETNEYMADWLEMTRMTNMLDGMERAKQATGAQHYLMLLTDLSRVTGKRRDQINDELKAMAADPGYQSAMQGIHEGIRDTVMKGNQLMVGYFGTFGDEFGKGLTDAVKGFDLLVTTDLGESLMAAGLTQEHAALQQLINQNRLGQVGEKEMKTRLQGIKESIVNNTAATIRMKNLSQGLSNAHYAAQRLKTSMILAGELTEEQAFRFAEIDRGYANMNEFFRGLTQTWTNFIATLFADEEFKKKLDKFAKAFEDFMKPDGPFAKNMESFAGMLAGGLLTGLEALSNAMKDPEFQATMAEIPGMFVSFGKALKGALTFIRDIFWKKNEKTGKWEVKTGEQMMIFIKERMELFWTYLTQPDGLLEHAFDGTADAITAIMTAVFTKIADLMWESAKSTFAKILLWITNPLAAMRGEQEQGENEPDDAYNKRKEGQWSSGDTGWAVTGVAAAELARRKIAKNRLLAATTNATIRTAEANALKAALARKEAAELAIKKAGGKFALRYGGTLALGPWAGVAAVGLLLVDMGIGAFDGLTDKANILEKKAGESKTAMEKFKTAAAGAMAMGIFDIKDVYDNVVDRSFMTNPAFLGGDHPDTNGKRAGIMNEAFGALWNMLTGMEDFSGAGFNYNLDTAWAAWKNRNVKSPAKSPGETTVTGTAVDPRIQYALDQVELMDLRATSTDKVTASLTRLHTATADLYTESGSLKRFGEQLEIIGHQADGITKVKDSMVELIKSTSTNAAHISAGVITTMAGQMGKLDDKMNDWDKGELSALNSITKSLGQMSGGNLQLLKDIKQELIYSNVHSKSELNADLWNSKQVIKAIKANGPYAD